MNELEKIKKEAEALSADCADIFTGYVLQMEFVDKLIDKAYAAGRTEAIKEVRGKIKEYDVGKYDIISILDEVEGEKHDLA
jgi:hypothetical protein